MCAVYLRMIARLPASLERFRGDEAATKGLLVECLAFLADADGVLPELFAEDSFYEDYDLESRDVDLVQ